mgnify:CR=1 FL=1
MHGTGGRRITMKELKQEWIDPRENMPSENKGPYLVWDDTYYIWRLCHFVEGKWDEIRTRDVYPLRHTYYKELDVPEQVSEMKEAIK